MNVMKMSVMAFVVSCLGSTAMAAKKYQLFGTEGMELAQAILEVEPLETENTADGSSVSTGRVVCEVITEKQRTPGMKAEQLPIDVVCSITQKYSALDAKSQKVKSFTETYQIGNAMNVFKLLMQSGAKSRGNKIVIQSLNCEVNGEMQAGDPDATPEFLPVNGACTIIQ